LSSIEPSSLADLAAGADFLDAEAAFFGAGDPFFDAEAPFEPDLADEALFFVFERFSITRILLLIV
jgi:hypothetical protein